MSIGIYNENVKLGFEWRPGMFSQFWCFRLGFLEMILKLKLGDIRNISD